MMVRVEWDTSGAVSVFKESLRKNKTQGGGFPGGCRIYSGTPREEAYKYIRSRYPNFWAEPEREVKDHEFGKLSLREQRFWKSQESRIKKEEPLGKIRYVGLYSVGNHLEPKVRTDGN